MSSRSPDPGVHPRAVAAHDCHVSDVPSGALHALGSAASHPASPEHPQAGTGDRSLARVRHARALGGAGRMGAAGCRSLPGPKGTSARAGRLTAIASLLLPVHGAAGLATGPVKPQRPGRRRSLPCSPARPARVGSLVAVPRVGSTRSSAALLEEAAGNFCAELSLLFRPAERFAGN